jgi:hypothetical protein
MVGVRRQPRLVQVIGRLLTDPVRAVRVEAARALAGNDPRTMTSEQQRAFGAAFDDWLQPSWWMPIARRRI